jgi:glutamate dehydrogenase
MGGQRALRIAVINDDMPFLVDSIAATITAQGLTIERLLHPVVAVRRDPLGALVDLPGRGDRRAARVDDLPRNRARRRQGPPRTGRRARRDAGRCPRRRRRLAADAEPDAAGSARLPDPEGAALLRWLADGMLTQLGHVTRHRDGTRSEALGICRASEAPCCPMPPTRAPSPGSNAPARAAGSRARAADRQGQPHCAVHRRVPLDLFLVPVVDDGQVTALSVHAGVWTSAALAATPDRVPRMRSQLEALMTRLGFDPAGHAGKALVHALTALPHDLLIGFSDADLERIATTMMGLVDRPRPRLALVRAALERHLYAFVWQPRDSQSTQVREQVTRMLEQATGGTVIDWAFRWRAARWRSPALPSTCAARTTR